VDILYTALQLIPVIEILLKIIVYIIIIYMLLGPLHKLVRALLVHLESKNSRFQNRGADNEPSIQETPEEEKEG
jgi:hypothetical protein